MLTSSRNFKWKAIHEWTTTSASGIVEQMRFHQWRVNVSSTNDFLVVKSKFPIKCEEKSCIGAGERTKTPRRTEKSICYFHLYDIRTCTSDKWAFSFALFTHFAKFCCGCRQYTLHSRPTLNCLSTQKPFHHITESEWALMKLVLRPWKLDSSLTHSSSPANFKRWGKIFALIESETIFSVSKICWGEGKMSLKFTPCCDRDFAVKCCIVRW